MQEDAEIKLERVDQRSKSNLHQIDEIKETIKELRKENDVIHELATSVRVMAERLGNIETKVEETAQGLERTEAKIDKKEKEQNIDKIRNIDKIKIAMLSAVGSAIAVALVNQLLSQTY